jgi:streptomycin 6-kinase
MNPVALDQVAPRQAATDPTLPGLARALDAEVMRELLCRHGTLPPEESLVIRHVRFHPRRGAWITYEVAERGAGADAGRPGNGRRRPALFYGRLDAPGIEPLAGHERDDVADGAGTEDVLLLPELPMVVRFFPHDAVLRRLAEVCRLSAIKRRVEAILATEGVDWKLKRSTALGTVVRYKPERRCVFRLHLDARGRASGRKRRLGFYGQVDSDGAGSEVARVLEDLASRVGAMGPVAVPRPFLYDERLGLLLNEEIEGTSLLDHLEREDVKKVLRRLAARVVDIQRSGVRPARRVELPDQLRTLTEVETMLHAVDEAREAGLDERAASIARLLTARATPPPLVGCIHGDFHAGQVLVRGRRSWIVDFDRVAVGDPLIDPATLAAGLLLEVTEGRLARPAARRAAKVFLRAYAEAWPAASDPERLAWQVAVTIHQSAVAPLRQLRPGWPALVSRRLDLAERIATGGEVLP